MHERKGFKTKTICNDCLHKDNSKVYMIWENVLDDQTTKDDIIHPKLSQAFYCPRCNNYLIAVYAGDSE